MRFTTTGSTLTNTFIIFTVAILSAIPVSIARIPSDDIPSALPERVIFSIPKRGTMYNPGEEVEVKWYVPKPRGKLGLRIGL